MPISTPLIVVLIPLLLGLLDIWLYWSGGNAATISATMLQVRVKYPVVAWITAYTFAVFLGHCFLPSPDPVPPPGHVVLAWFIVGMSPTFAALAIIMSGDGGRITMTDNIAVLEPMNQVKFAVVMLGSIIAGLIVGRMVLRQHPLAFVGG